MDKRPLTTRGRMLGLPHLLEKIEQIRNSDLSDGEKLGRIAVLATAARFDTQFEDAYLLGMVRAEREFRLLDMPQLAIRNRPRHTRRQIERVKELIKQGYSNPQIADMVRGNITANYVAGVRYKMRKENENFNHQYTENNQGAAK